MGQVDVLGIGLSTPYGTSLRKNWEDLMESRDTRRVAAVSGEWAGLTEPVFGHYKESASPGKLVHMAQIAAEGALFWGGRPDEVPWEPEVLLIGSSSDSYSAREHRWAVSPPRLSDRIGDVLQIERRMQFSNACAASSTAIATGMDLIRSGRAKMVLAGGADEITMSTIAGFQACRIYSDICRPFGAHREGLVLADGAAFLLLAAPGIGDPIATLNGAGLVCGAADVAAMSSGPIAKAMQMAMTEADIDRVDLVMAHGTGTRLNDWAESEAMASTWVREDMPMVASYKRWMGHPQGASGAIGLSLAIAAMMQQEVFSSVDYPPDPDLAIWDQVTIASNKARIDSAMVLSHGSWDVSTAIIALRNLP